MAMVLVSVIVGLGIATWPIRWNAAGRTEWIGLEVLAFLVLPILLFAAAKLVFPSESYASDLTPYFLENRRSFFGLVWLMLVTGAYCPFLFFNVAELGAEVGGPISPVSRRRLFRPRPTNGWYLLIE
jgi:hypothetical protein